MLRKLLMFFGVVFLLEVFLHIALFAGMEYSCPMDEYWDLEKEPYIIPHWTYYPYDYMDPSTVCLKSDPCCKPVPFAYRKMLLANLDFNFSVFAETFEKAAQGVEAVLEFKEKTAGWTNSILRSISWALNFHMPPFPITKSQGGQTEEAVVKEDAGGGGGGGSMNRIVLLAPINTY